MKILYSTVGTTRGGRSGKSETDDGKLKVQLATPVSMGGKGEGTNPEQLFACGYTGCFGSAIDHVAKLKKIAVKEINVRAKVDLGTMPDNSFRLAVEMVVWLPGVTPEEAKLLVEEAHRVCPYSNATRGNIDVKLTIAEAAF